MENTLNNDKENNEEAVLGSVAEESAAESTPTENAPENTPDSALEELAKSKAELAEAKDKYIRLYSEFDNFRRRTAKEKYDMISSAGEQLIRTLLPVVDDFERAEKSAREKNDKELEGFSLIYNKFKKIIEQNGVKLMEVGVGSDFNADVHEAITQIPAPEENLKGKVVDVIEKGYLLNDKVIRFAKVVVGN